MKYLSLAQIQESIRSLRPHNVLFGTTFLVLKKAGAPVGDTIRFQLDAANEDFLRRHYRVHPKSAHFFRVMRQNNPEKDWVEPDYAGKGLQSVNTRGTDAFLHKRNDRTWGFAPRYVEALTQKLPKGQKVPLFHLAAWIYKDREWKDRTTRPEIVSQFVQEYSITRPELEHLFEFRVVSSLSEQEAFSQLPVHWTQLLTGFTQPDDVEPESSGFLTFLEIEGLGPTPHLTFEPARRLNIITGDNGLGKTFLLDLSWWALTQDWADRPAFPTFPVKEEPKIKFVVSSGTHTGAVKANFSTQSFQWELRDKLPSQSGLVVYARVDGSFAIWDPANPTLSAGSRAWPGLKFTREEVWNGKSNQIEGLLRDWVRWQERPDKYPAFKTFQAVLHRVSPPDGKLEVNDPIRLPGDARPIPTLRHAYGSVPLLFESAGIKRIVTLAYLIVWAWEEHKIQAKQWGRKEERQMVVIVDEVEAHLHPKWQRVILPSLLGIASDLHAELSVQLIVATHSPLVMASSEPVFDNEQDKLFHLDMSHSGRVTFREIDFEIRGSVDSWLTSPVFQISQPGSPERERAIRDAVTLQEEKSPLKTDVEEVTSRLRDFLAPEDPFWVRWVFFAEKHGVRL